MENKGNNGAEIKKAIKERYDFTHSYNAVRS
jgi:hypothetical protein